MPGKFLPAQDQILRDVYPRLGSRGVINILPHFTPKQVCMRAFTLGVKVDEGWRNRLPGRPRSRHLSPTAVDHLAYSARWV